MNYENLTLLTDFYELTMMQGLWDARTENNIGVFDLFYRRNPFDSGYAVAAGLAQAVDYIRNLRFGDEEIEYLRSQLYFSEKFLAHLRDFKFTGELYAVPEGTVVFPGEPLLRVRAPVAEAQLMETALLNIINHQSLIATKAARVVWAAQGDAVLEFGLRRAQGPDAGLYGARAAVIGGCNATSNVLAGQMFDIPVRGTHAHSWVMNFPDELSAFRAYAESFPNACTLLVDTYNTLKSGVPNAIKIFSEMRSRGFDLKNCGIRLDSGDLAYLSKAARAMLDAAGFPDAVISASGDLDEYLIRDLKLQGAAITLWGVGTNLITSKDWPAFGGVYKLSALYENGETHYKMKLSDNPEKITNPGVKKIFRLYDRASGKMKADLIALEHEALNPAEALTIFHPLETWKRMTLPGGTYTARELLEPVFVKGTCVYTAPKVSEIRAYCKKELDTLWDEHKRLVNPHTIPVDLSLELWELKQGMIQKLHQ